MAKKKANYSVSFASSDKIKEYAVESKELKEVLRQRPSLFTSDLAPFWYHGQSFHQGIDQSAFDFYMARMRCAYGIDFSSLFTEHRSPRELEVLEFIRKNRVQSGLYPIPKNLKNWGGIKWLLDEDEVIEDEKEIPITGIIQVKEQFDYQKGYALTDPEFAKTDWKKEYDYFLKPANLRLYFDDGTTKDFSCREDVYYFLIASVSNNPRFRYKKEDALS